MIDDFTDVNAGEKDFMKMWNNHVQKYTFVGDCQMPKALAMFIDMRGQDIIQKNLFRFEKKSFVKYVSNINIFQEFLSSPRQSV